ncbi:hypothetical protein LCGC14_1801730 [marine sediment metagenome]|uniref:Uncharacterized protein n=1 Tax=marine sediment metagenome TaxID=412755 RepID=A0A0F9J450_9ZZZZ
MLGRPKKSCSGVVKKEGNRPCLNGAWIKRNGKRWCWIHDPENEQSQIAHSKGVATKLKNYSFQ